MPPRECRLLHWVLKVADRTGEVEFLHDVLGMHALRRAVPDLPVITCPRVLPRNLATQPGVASQTRGVRRGL